MRADNSRIHHAVDIHGRCGEFLLEACRYLPGLVPDPRGSDA